MAGHKKARYKNTNADKEKAIAEGRVYYIGSPHRCGSVIRYVSNGLCHHCERVRGRKKFAEGATTPYRENCVKRRRAAINRISLTKEEKHAIIEVYKHAKEMSASTGIPHEVDHVIPISKGGLHHPDNLQVLTKDDNRQKGSNYHRYPFRH